MVRYAESLEARLGLIEVSGLQKLEVRAGTREADMYR
jgi:hypothetical protein